MTELILYIPAGLGIFFSFLILAASGTPRSNPDFQALTAVQRMAGLEGLSFAHFELLLDDADYRVLRSLPALRQIARQFRKERAELVLLWIGLLLGDLKNLWRLRRFLVRCGAPSGFGEELQVLLCYSSSMILLHVVKLLVRTCGPFALRAATRRAGTLVVGIAHIPALVLSRIPATRWAEIEQNWGESAA